ncbi:hypothetical protein M9H77_15438 [Catharanthus roseus]|uniref:Uncharacterized protein n=1 Tax=Catharanthus roseus TaxID=4058 RepID=A0ACC0AZ66_CATRO|nr:hypothetical protein M9H77_15438 [Catharanthus roseus]
MQQEKKKKDVQLQAMWFAAGTAAVLACIQRAILVSFMEQWRMLVFLALNLLLLAILFTSTHNPISLNEEINSNCSSNSNNTSLKKHRSISATPLPPQENCGIENSNLVEIGDGGGGGGGKTEKVADLDENIVDESCAKKDEEAPPELSKEELNKRAEAFIAMFRQHLVSDAKAGGKICRLQSYSQLHSKEGDQIMAKRRASHSGRHHSGEKPFRGRFSYS